MQTQLEEAMNLSVDQTMIIDIGENEPAATALGESQPDPLAGTMVI